ncbi:MAG: GNAT family N-acetyltransferase [Gammaproteobacteria bacterium]|nr:MAG: GNAT family N-acetyltransferase [Gammaproteobacteria bacterium]
MPETLDVHAVRTPEERTAAMQLRWAILRAPLGLPPGSERDAEDETALLVVACRSDGRVVGTGRLHPVDDGTGQIRYMAVAEDCRGQGVGARLLAALEAAALEQGLKRIVLNARENVAGFYARFGYRQLAPGPLLYGKIPHLRMEKYLT